LVLTPAIKALTEFTKYTEKHKKWPDGNGVYALYNRELLELQSNSQSQYAISRMTVMGADVISQLSGIIFPEGTIEFIIFRGSATTFNKIPLSKIARIDMQANTAWEGDGTKMSYGWLRRRYDCQTLLFFRGGLTVMPKISSNF
jgi:hypothetical protein